jgi:hypothetical protein
MKRVLLILLLTIIMTVAAGIPAYAVDLELPNDKVIENLPDQAGKATKSGKITQETCPICGGTVCVPPCPNA